LSSSPTKGAGTITPSTPRSKTGSVETPEITVEVKQESHLSKEVSATVLDILVDIVEEVQSDLNQAASVFMKPVTHLFIQLLRKAQAHYLLLVIIAAVRSFLYLILPIP
jgi:hypothetical protein